MERAAPTGFKGLKPSYTLRLVLLTHQYSANIKGVMFASAMSCCVKQAGLDPNADSWMQK